MRDTPVLVLVDPRAQHRAEVRRRVSSLLLGGAFAGVSAIPFVLSLLH